MESEEGKAIEKGTLMTEPVVSIPFASGAKPLKMEWNNRCLFDPTAEG